MSESLSSVENGVRSAAAMAEESASTWPEMLRQVGNVHFSMLAIRHVLQGVETPSA